MTPPELAAQRFAAALIIGALLGLGYEFLRPLRPRFTVLADGMFLAAVVWSWLIHAFAVCRGEFRIAYFGAMIMGGLGWCGLTGRVTRRVFTGFWKIIGKIILLSLAPIKIIFKKLKKMFASGEKWVTIRWSCRRHMKGGLGGKSNGRIKRIFQPDQAGSNAHSQPGEGDCHGGHRTVYGGADWPSGMHHES